MGCQATQCNAGGCWIENPQEVFNAKLYLIMPKPQKKRSFKKIKKKKSKIKEIKKASLEKDIEETENIIDDNQFRKFLQPVQISPEPNLMEVERQGTVGALRAPVLTKVETPNLEINISSSPMVQTKEKRVDYISRNEQKYSDTTITDDLDEKKYESEFRPPILRQTESRRTRQEILEPPREAGMQESQDPSLIETNILEQQRREPFETQEKKYREAKF